MKVKYVQLFIGKKAFWVYRIVQNEYYMEPLKWKFLGCLFPLIIHFHTSETYYDS